MITRTVALGRHTFHIAVCTLAACALAWAGCDATEPGAGGAGEQELVTRVALTFTPSGGGAATTFTAEDADGDGELDSVEDIVLQSETSYEGAVELFDDVNGEEITPEVADEEDYAHRFLYTLSGEAAGRITISGLSTDRNGLPLGQTFEAVVSSGGAASGTLRVVLRHYDDREPDDTSPKNPNGGETDVLIDFPVTIQ